jgi:mannose-6-phosphate isomerase-like protein (cupin superfamily)
MRVVIIPGVAEIRVFPPDSEEIVTIGPISIRILEDGTDTHHRISMAEITVPPRTEGPPQHWHARHDEGFYVVSGQARFTVGEAQHQAPAGTLVMVPPRVPHTFGNPEPERCVILNTFTPDFYIGYLRELGQLMRPGGTLDNALILRVMARYETYPAGGGPTA